MNLQLSNPILALLALINGKTRNMDAFSVIQGTTITYSHLSVSWGFVADIDIESEKYRALGSLRYTISAIVRLLRLRTYEGTLYLLESNNAHGLEIKDGLQGSYLLTKVNIY